jgi:hypothetical protein
MQRALRSWKTILALLSRVVDEPSELGLAAIRRQEAVRYIKNWLTGHSGAMPEISLQWFGESKLGEGVEIGGRSETTGMPISLHTPISTL